MILTLRTDKPEAELHLLAADGKAIAEHTWVAHRELAATLVPTIQTFLGEQDTSTRELTGLLVFSGAGSFTGLRIGATVANALAYANNIPIAAGEGQDWITDGLSKLKTAKPGDYVVPTYDREPNITRPKE